MIFTVLLLAIQYVCASRNLSLQEAIRATAGIFRDKSLVQDSELSKTVLTVVVNFGYLNHLQNFLCFTERLQMEPLIISVEPKAHEFITQKTNYTSHLINTKLRLNDTIESDSAGWRSRQFSLISNLKIVAAVEIMKLGYHVLFADPDVVILDNPMPYLFWKNMDYVHSMNVPCDLNQNWDYLHNHELEGNTGFYWVKSLDRTIKLFEESISIAPQFGNLDDQSIFWILMRKIFDPPIHTVGKCRNVEDNENSVLYNSSSTFSSPRRNVVACALDACMFSSGMINGVDRWGNLRWNVLRNNIKTMNNSVVSVHANWIIGNHKKKSNLQLAGLWLNKEDAKLHSDFGPNNCKVYSPTQIQPVKNGIVHHQPTVSQGKRSTGSAKQMHMRGQHQVHGGGVLQHPSGL